MKRSRILLCTCLLCLALVLSACGGSKNEQPASGTELQIPEGVYVEEIANRGVMTVTAGPNGEAVIHIDWPSSAFSRSAWDMTARYDAAQQAFVYADAVRVDTEFSDQTQSSDKVVYTHGTGKLLYANNKVSWYADDTEIIQGSSFVYSMSVEDYRRSQDDSSTPGGSELIIVTPAPVEVSTPTPAPTALPTATPAPTPKQESLPIITKDPTDETVDAGGSCMFIASYENAIWARWHFLSPDGKMDIQYDAINTQFPNLIVVHGEYSDLRLQNIPYELNGWRVYCRYSNNDGYVDTKTALITVKKAPAPTPTPAPAPTQEPTPEPQPSVGPVVNEWKDTDSVIEATYGAGFNFTPPLDQVIPSGLTLKGYRYKVGILEADYADANGVTQLIIRKSNSDTGLDLHGDHNSYSSNWDHTLKGLLLHCLGNGETVNTCWFDAGDMHFSISCHMGREGEGLTLDEINSIVNCIQ